MDTGDGFTQQKGATAAGLAAASAVEAADGFEGLVELLPKLRTAVGEERLAPLKAALEGK